MTLPHPLPDELADLIARRFRVLGEPMRIRLLDRLREGEANVNELTEALGASQQNVSSTSPSSPRPASLAAARPAPMSTTGSSMRASSPSASRSAARSSSSCAPSASSSKR